MQVCGRGTGGGVHRTVSPSSALLTHRFKVSVCRNSALNKSSISSSRTMNSASCEAEDSKGFEGARSAGTGGGQGMGGGSKNQHYCLVRTSQESKGPAWRVVILLAGRIVGVNDKCHQDQNGYGARDPEIRNLTSRST